MKHCYLKVTYRNGRPWAAYYYLPQRSEDRSVRTQEILAGILVDFTADGRAIGIEITSPSRLVLDHLNDALGSVGLAPIPREELAALLAG